MRALHYSVAMKRELLKKAKLSIFKTVFVHILTNGHESLVMIERLRSQEQGSGMIFFFEKSKELNYFTSCVDLRFENLSTSRRYFFKLKDLSLDGLVL